jgi:dUTP pyrophosphatase
MEAKDKAAGKPAPKTGGQQKKAPTKAPGTAGANPGAGASLPAAGTQEPGSAASGAEIPAVVAKAVTVAVKIVSEGGRLPEYKSDGAAGADLFACEECVLNPGRWALVNTGIAIEVPEGYEAEMRPRSGLALKSGITLMNSPGTIDSDYRGEVGVILVNHSSYPFKVHIGDRIAQLLIKQVERASFEVQGQLSETQRGSGGYGSTGGIA